MLIKPGVDISRLNPEIRGVLIRAAETLMEEGDELVVTSTYEGEHRENSYHYSNDAFDFVGRYDFKRKYAINLKIKIMPHFDVVYEGDHVHVELDRNKYNKKKE